MKPLRGCPESPLNWSHNLGVIERQSPVSTLPSGWKPEIKGCYLTFENLRSEKRMARRTDGFWKGSGALLPLPR
jgi:hypothetical protein